MRILIAMLLVSSQAEADNVRATLGGSVGAGQIDDDAGMVGSVSSEVGFIHARTLIGVELGIAGISHADNSDGPDDIQIGAHVRHRMLGRLGPWLGGGVVAHQILSADVAMTSARGQLDTGRASRWEPGVDLQLFYELRVPGEWVAGYIGLRAFAIRDGRLRMSKPTMPGMPQVGYGLDGGIVVEAGYIYGR